MPPIQPSDDATSDINTNSSSTDISDTDIDAVMEADYDDNNEEEFYTETCNCDETISEPTDQETFTWTHDNVKYGFHITQLKDKNSGKVYDQYSICYYDDQNNKHPVHNNTHLNAKLIDLRYDEHNMDYTIANSTSKYFEINDSLFCIMLQKKNSRSKMISILKYGWSDKYNEVTITQQIGVTACVTNPLGALEKLDGNIYDLATNPEVFLKLNQYDGNYYYNYNLYCDDIPGCFANSVTFEDKDLHPNLK